MNSAALASLLHARKSGKGKWMARCTIHGRDRIPSLSITDMGDGKTRLHCFAGCVQADILARYGLTWRDLTAERPLDREAYRAVEMERARQEQAEARRKATYRSLATQSLFWERQAGEAGRMLAEDLSCEWLAREFHESLRKVRILNAAIAGWPIGGKRIYGWSNPSTETIVAKRRRRSVK